MLKIGINAREAALALGAAGEALRNLALQAMADELRKDTADICAANANDIRDAKSNGIKPSMVDRLRLDPERVEGIASAIEEIIALPDPIGRVLDGWARPNGLRIEKTRVSLGVVGVIYESRPNVTADAAALCVKSGNACILRGGKEAIHSNIAIGKALRRALKESGLPEDCVQVMEDPSREKARELMRLNGYVDVLIPRGGAGLIQSVIENASVPVIETGTGVCHIYVDRDCDDFAMAMAVIENAKVSRPSVCNAMETLLVDAVIAGEFLPECASRLSGLGVELRGCEAARAIVPDMLPAVENDWSTEYNDLILSVRVVNGVEEAIRHINRYGTRHSECILTNNLRTANLFQHLVDAAAVYVNASTRFTDGGEFGFGAEIGISNQKLHARGPVGLSELTTTKYLIMGEGQIR